MRQSMRAKRMQRHHKRNGKSAKLSLVSLMDIFTILVFFLMLNASDVQVLQSSDKVKLPESSADTAAQETLLLLVTIDEVLLQGKALASTEALAQRQPEALEALAAELEYHAKRDLRIQLPVTQAQTVSANAAGLNDDKSNDQGNDLAQAQSITIMGDAGIPYAVLKQVMQACSAQGYTNIALAVENKQNTGSALSTPDGQGDVSALPALTGEGS